MSIELKIEQLTNEDGLLPLYYEVQGNESKAYMALDTRTHEVWVKTKHPSDNGCSPDEAYGTIRTFWIPNNLTVTGINRLLNNETVKSLLIDICNGAERYWDGNNYRTKLSEYALGAEMHLETTLGWAADDYESLEPADAAYYLDGVALDKIILQGESDVAAAARIQEEAIKSEGFYMSIDNILATIESKKVN